MYTNIRYHYMTSHLLTGRWPLDLSRAMPLHDFFMDDSDKEDISPLEQQRRRQQTEKGRISAMVSRRVAQDQQGPSQNVVPSGQSALDSTDLGKAKELQKQYLTKRIHHAYSMTKAYEVSDRDPKKKIFKSRARCVWSLLCCLANVLEHILLVNDTARNRLKSVINTIVPDDTTTRLKGPAVGDKSIVCAIMNQVQNCIATYEQKLEGFDGVKRYDWHCLSLPCPTRVLNVADAVNIHAGYTSYMISAAGGIGQSLQRLGFPKDIPTLEQANWVIQVMCGDALEANSSAFHSERRLLAHKRFQEGSGFNRAAIRFKCCNHQLGLIRKPVVLGVARYWSTLVRLAHLFECAGFRRRVAAGMVALLSGSGPGAFQRTSASSSSLFYLFSTWSFLVMILEELVLPLPFGTTF